MRIKRGELFILTFILLGILLSSFVAAQADRGVGDALDKAIDTVTPVFEYAFGGVVDQDVLFVKFLIFVIILAICAMVLNRIPVFEGKKAIIAIISIAIAIIASRYLTEVQVINFIILPYSVLGIVLSAILPFLIFFYFIKDFDEIIRKIGWIAFACIFAGLAYARYPNFAIPGAPWWKNLAMIYLAIAIISLLMFIFDKTISRALFKSKLRRLGSVKQASQAYTLTHNIDELREQLAKETDKDQINKLREKIEQKKKALKALLKT